MAVSVLGLLLESELVAVAALSLAAIGGLERQGRIALPADLLIAVELLGNSRNSGIHSASPQSEHEVQSGLLLDVVVRKGATV